MRAMGAGRKRDCQGYFERAGRELGLGSQVVPRLGRVSAGAARMSSEVGNLWYASGTTASHKSIAALERGRELPSSIAIRGRSSHVSE